MRTAESKTKTIPSGYLPAILLSAAITAALLAAAALLFCTGKVGYETAPEIITAINFAGAAAAGVLTAGRQGRGAIKSGIICGIVYTVLLLLAGLALTGGQLSGSDGARIAICSSCGGTFGGVLCLKRGNKKLHKKRSKNK